MKRLRPSLRRRLFALLSLLAASEPGQGTTFEVRLPLAPPALPH